MFSYSCSHREMLVMSAEWRAGRECSASSRRGRGAAVRVARAGAVRVTLEDLPANAGEDAAGDDVELADEPAGGVSPVPGVHRREDGPAGVRRVLLEPAACANTCWEDRHQLPLPHAHRARREVVQRGQVQAARDAHHPAPARAQVPPAAPRAPRPRPRPFFPVQCCRERATRVSALIASCRSSRSRLSRSTRRPKRRWPTAMPAQAPRSCRTRSSKASTAPCLTWKTFLATSTKHVPFVCEHYCSHHCVCLSFTLHRNTLAYALDETRHGNS